MVKFVDSNITVLLKENLTFSWENRVRILISLNVRWQYVRCSNGEIFLMATLRLSSFVSFAELRNGSWIDLMNERIDSMLVYNGTVCIIQSDKDSKVDSIVYERE